MTPAQLARARERLGLTLEAMATMLGYQGVQRRQMQYDLETGRRDVREPQRRLVEAYLAGYRPQDWPTQERRRD
jgi:transcriptional regulator with XRE-family HTH domain